MVEVMYNFCLDFDFCEHCVYGKNNWLRFPFDASREEGILQLVHSDVFGPVAFPSFEKSVYYVSFIDDFLRKNWIYFLRKKSESLTDLKSLSLLLRIKQRNELRW